MYTLTLTKAERDAIDWIGPRYWHGDQLYRRIWGDSTQSPDDADWDTPVDITFHVPEHVAWEIRDSINYDDGDEKLACFSDELKSKLLAFCDSIV